MAVYTYATIDDFLLAFGLQEAIELSHLDDCSDVIDTDVIQRGLDTASAEISSYVQAGGYALPLAVVPGILREYALDIARYRLDRVRARDDVRRRYEDALSWLTKLAKQIVLLGVALDNTIAVIPDSDLVDYYTNERIFTEASLIDYTTPLGLPISSEFDDLVVKEDDGRGF